MAQVTTQQVAYFRHRRAYLQYLQDLAAVAKGGEATGTGDRGSCSADVAAAIFAVSLAPRVAGSFHAHSHLAAAALLCRWASHVCRGRCTAATVHAGRPFAPASERPRQRPRWVHRSSLANLPPWARRARAGTPARPVPHRASLQGGSAATVARARSGSPAVPPAQTCLPSVPHLTPRGRRRLRPRPRGRRACPGPRHHAVVISAGHARPQCGRPRARP